MANPILENIAKTNSDALAKSSRAVERIMRAGADALLKAAMPREQRFRS